MRSKFSCVRSSHNLCAPAQAHSLDGTLAMGISDLMFLASAYECGDQYSPHVVSSSY